MRRLLIRWINYYVQYYNYITTITGTKQNDRNNKMMQFSLSQSSSRLFLLVVILGSSCMIQSGFCFVERTATTTATTIRNANAYTNASPSKTSLFTTSFDNLRKAFPQNADIVQAGGWYNLEQLSNDPKGALVEFVVDGLKGAASSVQQQQPVDKNEKLQALCLLLYGMGKGFTADAIDGEWDLVFTKQGSKSPSFQKLVGKTETAGRSKNFFDIKKMIFSGDVRFWKWGKVSTTVKVCMYVLLYVQYEL